jgi:hypothetical protein
VLATYLDGGAEGLQPKAHVTFLTIDIAGPLQLVVSSDPTPFKFLTTLIEGFFILYTVLNLIY